MSTPPRRSKVNTPATAPTPTAAAKPPNNADVRASATGWSRLRLVGKPQDLPSTLCGSAGQHRRGVDRVREADTVKQRDILFAIGVRVAVFQRGSFAFGEFLDRGQLAFPPRRTSYYAAGEHAVLGLKLSAQDMVDTQFAGHGLRLHPCRRCRDDNGVAPVLVRAHQSPCPMKERSGDFLGEQLFPELHKVVFGASHPTSDSLQ